MRFVPVALLLAVIVVGCAPTASEGTAKPTREATPKPTREATAKPTRATELTFTGSGQQSTEVFDLAAGDYLIAWTAHAPDGHGCPYSITLEPIGHDEFIAFVAFDIAPESEIREGSETQRLDGGRYAFDISGTCDWTVTISPRS